MIRISLMTGPVDVPLDDLLPGLSLRVNRLNSMDFALARDRADTAVQNLREGLSALAEYGLHQPDAVGERLDVTDQAQMFRIGHLIFSTELALLAVASWIGPVLEDGKPAPVCRETLSRLLMDERVEQRVLKEIGAAAQIVVAEKKDSPTSLNGTAAEDGTGSVQNTAPVAQNPVSPVPEVSQATVGDTAPKSN